MYISDTTLDDLLRRVLEKLLASKNSIYPTRGQATELRGVLLQLTNPRARLSRTERRGKVFSCLGELLWYLSGTNDVKFISYYVQQYEKESDDGITVHGGYGPRFFSMKRGALKIDQIANVLSLLKKNPESRRAVVQLFDAADLAQDYKEIPCTCTLQFMIRRRRLHMFTSMRSNDAFLGLPHDIFAFTMIQEIMARTLNLEPGRYKHFVSSLHLYKEHKKGAQQYLAEGFQPRISMPPMPLGDPWRSISKLIKAEQVIRRGRRLNSISALKFDPYWTDLVRLLQIYRHAKNGEHREITRLKRGMAVSIYDPYIEEKKKTAFKLSEKSRLEQLDLF